MEQKVEDPRTSDCVHDDVGVPQQDRHRLLPLQSRQRDHEDTDEVVAGLESGDADPKRSEQVKELHLLVPVVHRQLLREQARLSLVLQVHYLEAVLRGEDLFDF